MWNKNNGILDFLVWDLINICGFLIYCKKFVLKKINE